MRHEALALRVAEPDVVLEELDIIALDHEPGENDVGEGAARRHAVDGRLNDVLHHLLPSMAGVRTGAGE